MRPYGQPTAGNPLRRERFFVRIVRLILRRSATLGGQDMPSKKWRFLCGCHNERTLFGRAHCHRCNEMGICDGFHLSMYESMAAYQKTYGLKPVGFHGKYAREVMGPLFRCCDVCDGRGVLEQPGEDTCCRCPLCNGSLARFAELRPIGPVRYTATPTHGVTPTTPRPPEAPPPRRGFFMRRSWPSDAKLSRFLMPFSAPAK